MHAAFNLVKANPQEQINNKLTSFKSDQQGIDQF